MIYLNGVPYSDISNVIGDLNVVGDLSIGGNITTLSGGLSIIPASGPVTIGDAGSTSQSLTANDDLFVSGKLEVDDVLYCDGIFRCSGVAEFSSFFHMFSGVQIRGGLQFQTNDGYHIFVDNVNGRSNNNIIFTADDNRSKNHGHTPGSADPTVIGHSNNDPTGAGATEWWSITHNRTDGVIATGKGKLKLAGATGVLVTAALRGETSLWYHYRQVSALDVSPGVSGAVFTPPNANTLGGYQLDVSTEYLYFGADVHSDWDGATDVIVNVFFEVNIDNSGGGAGDTVDLQLLCYMKGDAETACKLQTLEEAVIVGQSAQYKQFKATFTIDYDDGSDPVQVDDVFSMRLNLETDTSEVDNVIINHFEFKYLSAQPNAIEA